MDQHCEGVLTRRQLYLPVGFYSTEVPIFLEDTNVYKMGESGQWKHNLFLDDLKTLSKKPSEARDFK